MKTKYNNQDARILWIYLFNQINCWVFFSDYSNWSLLILSNVSKKSFSPSL